MKFARVFNKFACIEMKDSLKLRMIFAIQDELVLEFASKTTPLAVAPYTTLSFIDFHVCSSPKRTELKVVSFIDLYV